MLSEYFLKIDFLHVVVFLVNKLMHREFDVTIVEFVQHLTTDFRLLMIQNFFHNVH